MIGRVVKSLIDRQPGDLTGTWVLIETSPRLAIDSN
jgi:hypothetical protein